MSVPSTMLVGLRSDTPRSLEDLLGPGLAARLDRLDVFSRKLLAGKMPGERRSKRRGRSVEFDDFRSYVPGDDLRHIDWNIYARFDRLVVKLFREEEDLALHLVVDASPSMDAGSPNKLIFAHQLAMALAYIGLVNQNRVTLAFAGHAVGQGAGQVHQLAPLRGRSNLRRVADALLESVRERRRAGPAQNAPDLNAAWRSIASTRSGRGIVVLLSDCLSDSPLTTALNAFGGVAQGGFDTYCLQILAPGELDPAREAEHGLLGDLRLTDAETGKAAEVSISPALIAKYKAGIQGYIENLRGACSKRGIAHFLVPTETPIDLLVLGSLRRGGMLR